MVVTCSKLCLLKFPALGGTPLSFLLYITRGQSLLYHVCCSSSCLPHQSCGCSRHRRLWVTRRWGDNPTLDLGHPAKTLSHTHHQEPLPGSSSMTPGIVWSSGLPIRAYSPFPSPLSKTTAISCSPVTILKFCRAFIWHHMLAPSLCIT